VAHASSPFPTQGVIGVDSINFQAIWKRIMFGFRWVESDHGKYPENLDRVIDETAIPANGKHRRMSA
jgi:hypothetical protein